jgi:hypothetical protein
MMDFLSVCTGFLIGAVTGSAGTYFGGVFTDQRKRQEAVKAERRAFSDLASQMPELFRAIKADLEADGQEFTREVFLLPGGANLSGFEDRGHFTYRDRDHAALREKFDLLEHAHFVSDITPGNAPEYRLSESFVTHLRTWRTE